MRLSTELREARDKRPRNETIQQIEERLAIKRGDFRFSPLESTSAISALVTSRF